LASVATGRCCDGDGDGDGLSFVAAVSPSRFLHPPPHPVPALASRSGVVICASRRGPTGRVARAGVRRVAVRRAAPDSRAPRAGVPGAPHQRARPRRAGRHRRAVRVARRADRRSGHHRRRWQRTRGCAPGGHGRPPFAGILRWECWSWKETCAGPITSVYPEFCWTRDNCKWLAALEMIMIFLELDLSGIAYLAILMSEFQSLSSHLLSHAFRWLNVF
jgi:hypothetical protein